MLQNLERRTEKEDFQVWLLNGWETGSRHSCSLQGKKPEAFTVWLPARRRKTAFKTFWEWTFWRLPKLRLLPLEVSLPKPASRT